LTILNDTPRNSFTLIRLALLSDPDDNFQMLPEGFSIENPTFLLKDRIVMQSIHTSFYKDNS
jgi:hypothetical protein